MTGKVWSRILPAAFVMSAVLAVMGAGRVAQPPSPAPAAFDNKSNDEVDEPQAKFIDDKDSFDETEEVFPKPLRVPEVRGGLGPVYNATSCVGCHQNAGFVVKDKTTGVFPSENPPKTGKFFSGNDAVSGTSSQVSEIRAGHLEEGAGGQKFFRDAPGGSVIQQRAIDPKLQEHVPKSEDIRTLRMATSVLGDGFVESIPDLAIIQVRDAQDPAVRGFANIVPVAVDVARDDSGNPILDADGQPKDFIFEPRIGRFGWKSQEASLLNFSANAYVTEMGITSPLQKIENTSLDQPVTDFDPLKEPEDKANFRLATPIKFGKDVEAFARFMRFTKAPPQADSVMPPNVAEGERVFRQIGCAECHHPEFTTVATSTRFGDFQVPAPMTNKTIKPYSDFLLHDIGTGDGIVQTQYSELPPTGLIPIDRETLAASPWARMLAGESTTSGSRRLNDLLSGKADPECRNHPKQCRDLAVTDLRTDPECLRQPRMCQDLGLRAVDIARVPPVIQVIPALGATFRVSRMIGMSEVSLVPWLYTTTTAMMIRTAPLWGLRTRPQLLHNGSALTVLEAIEVHRIQAEKARSAFDGLSGEERQKVLDFLNFL